MTKTVEKLEVSGHNVSVLNTREKGDNINLGELINKEVKVTMKDGKVIEGIVRDVPSKEEIVLARNGDWDNRVSIYNNEVKKIDSSSHPYYSNSHKIDLREQKKPRFEFRFNERELYNLVGKYASINYDGKLIEGKIIDCIFRGYNYNEVVIESLSGEIKSIHDYRLRDLEITGSSLPEHQGFKQMRKIEEELFIMLEDFNKECPEGPDCKVIEPDYLLERYFEARLKVTEGFNVDLNEFNYSWIQETADRRSEYPNGNSIDKSFYKDVKKSRDLNDYYNFKKSFIDIIFCKISDVDWSTYGKNQTKGEIDALNYIYESGLITQ